MGQSAEKRTGDDADGAAAALVEVRDALIALGQGDFRPRTIKGAVVPELAAALHKVTRALAARNPSDAWPAASGSTDQGPPMAWSGDAHPSFIAIMELEAWADSFTDIDFREQASIFADLSDRIHQVMPGATIGRVGRSTVEFRFEADSVVHADQSLNTLVKWVERSLAPPSGAAHLRVWIGFAEWVSPQASLFRVVEYAQFALSKARQGHTQVAAFTEQDRFDADERKALLHDMSHALERGELSMVYQPKLSLRSKTIEAAEALIRWRHPVRGWVSPSDFIWLAERSGEIDRITRFTIDRVIQEQTALADKGWPLAININISGQLIAEESFVDWAMAAVQGATGSIGFEITETAVISDPTRALTQMRRLSAAGIPISIDDYGSGLSSLVYLKQFPARELKIDRAFISELTRSNRDPLIVRSTIDLAHALDMEVTAEGVENAMTLSLLQVMGCDHAQGYHVAKPMTADDLAAFMAEYKDNQVLNFAALSPRRAL